jgi:hypothetical protein
MNKSTKIITIVLVCVVLSLSFFASYRIGYINATEKSYQAGYDAGVLEASHNANLAQARVSQAYENGYNAGLKAQGNSTGIG